MLDKKVVELLNQQVNKEFYSAYLYLDFQIIFMMRAWTDSETGIRCRHRRSATMQCCLCSTC